MSLRSRVAWSEGTLLLPQHFQQQERFVEALVEARTGKIRPYAWGLLDMQRNTDLDTQGKFALRACAGVMPDGTPFRFPDGDPSPPELDLPPSAAGAIIYLTLPNRRDQAVEFAAAGAVGSGARYHLGEVTAFDNLRPSPEGEPIEVGGLALSYEVGSDRPLQGRTRIAVARVAEMRDGRPVYDTGFAPTVMDVAASPVLAGWLHDMWSRAQRRQMELARRSVESDAGMAGASYATLQMLNRWAPLLNHLRQRQTVHPEELFGVLLQICGELATYTTPQRYLVEDDPGAPILYRHDDLTASFRPLIKGLIDMLGHLYEEVSYRLELHELTPEQDYVSPIQERTTYFRDTLFLAVYVPGRSQEVRTSFKDLAKIASVDSIDQAKYLADSPIPLTPWDRAPPEIHGQDGYVYFELIKKAPTWDEFASSPGLAVFVPARWPGLKLELWAVRRS